MPTAADALALIAELPDAEAKKVRSDKARNATKERQAHARERYDAVRRLITAEGMKTTGRGAWAEILKRLMDVAPALAYKRPLPDGMTLDLLPTHWHSRNLMKPKGLRRSYLETSRDVDSGR